METFDAWFNRTIAESDVEEGITDRAAVRRLVTLLEAVPPAGRLGAPAQLDAA